MAVGLVIGGKGFVGAAVIQGLIATGHRVVCLEPDTSSLGRLARLGEQVELVSGRVEDQQQLTRLAQDLRPTSMINLVYARGLEVAAEMDVMCRGLWNTLEAARVAGCPRVVLASSVRVYGSQSAHGQDVVLDEGSACLPVVRYGFVKLLGERLAADFRSTYAMESVALRIPMVYGPGIRSGAMGVAIPAVAARDGESAVLPFDPAAKLCLAHVDDVAAAVVALAGCQPGPQHPLYELGGHIASYVDMVETAQALVPHARLSFSRGPGEGNGPEHEFAYRLSNARLHDEFQIVHRPLLDGYRTIVEEPAHQ